MFKLRIISVCLGHTGVADKEMGATYLKSFEVEIQIAFSLGLSG